MKQLFNNRRNILACAIAASFVFGFAGGATAADMTLSVDPARAPLSKEGSVMIKGAGFKPGSEVFMLIVTKDGLESDVAEYLDPPLAIGEDGSFSTKLSYGAFVKRKLLEANTYPVSITDSGYNVLAKTEITFEKQ